MASRSSTNFVHIVTSVILATLFHVSATSGQYAVNSATLGRSSRTLITFDASLPIPTVHALPMKMGGSSPNGHELGLNDRYLTLDGKPWLPVMGEFHYSRYPEANWEDELLKMKAAGVDIVSTYVIWNHHEEVQGEFDWTGQRNLRHFVALCTKHGLFVFVRIGPYAHGEVRRGGLPDWLVAEGPVRRNAPDYLNQVRRFYGEISKELRGMLWKEGGSIIGIQLENEYLVHGADAGAAHIAALKQIALDVGLDAPLFTVTGWGNADFPSTEVIPVHGVYPDAFWESSLKELPPSDAYLFDLQRDTGGILAGPERSQKTDKAKLREYPLLLAEAGGGMQVAYHRRPAIKTEDVAAILVTHLGSGANLYGYYMFQGGTNPQGKRTTLQESAAIDGVYDLPVVSYDFQAPLGEFGQVRPWYRTLKLFHFFLNEFGSELAPMVPVPPDVQPKGPEDRTTPRVALRTDGEHSFFFLNNYLRDYPMAELRQLQFQVRLKNETIEFPCHPIDVPSGSYFIWPVNLDLRGISLRYATAQLVSSFDDNGERYYFFYVAKGTSPEFAFTASTVRSIHVSHGNSSRSGGEILVQGISPGTDVAFSATSPEGKKIHIVVLPGEQAQNLWVATITGHERAILSRADVFLDGDDLHIRSQDNQQLAFGMAPPFVGVPSSKAPLSPEKQDGIFMGYKASVPLRKLALNWTILQKPVPTSPVTMGKYNAVAPTDADFIRSGVWKIEIPKVNPLGLSEMFLKVEYQGDVARFFRGPQLLDDNFYNGAPWEIGLKQFLSDKGPTDFELKVTPLRKAAPIYLPADAWPNFGTSGAVAEVKHLALIPEYEAIIHFWLASLPRKLPGN